MVAANLQIKNYTRKEMPYLREVNIPPISKESPEYQQFPYSLPMFARGLHWKLEQNVTILVGENGSGKSTLLEAIAQECGFNPAGGNRNHYYAYKKTESQLASNVQLSWMPKVTNGFFMRAESFFNFCSYLDELAKVDAKALISYGGTSLHEQSHGEAFLSLFSNLFQKGIYILDEPEAALSPSRQLAFLSIIHNLDTRNLGQFIIATHSPIILTYPRAEVFLADKEEIKKIDYRECEHYKLTKSFLNNPERYFRHLFDGT